MVEVVEQEHGAGRVRAPVAQGAEEVAVGPGVPGDGAGGARRVVVAAPGVAVHLVRLGVGALGAGPQDGGAAFGGRPGEQVQQAGLAEAGIGREVEHRAVPGAQPVHGPGQRGALLVPSG